MKNFPKFLEKQHKYFAEKVREGGKSRSYADVIHGSPMLGCQVQNMAGDGRGGQQQHCMRRGTCPSHSLCRLLMIKTSHATAAALEQFFFLATWDGRTGGD